VECLVLPWDTVMISYLYMKLTFLGGAGQVTGSNYLLNDGKASLLIDCGLHQGTAAEEAENSQPFRFDIKSIAAVFITHAHIDHIGRVPKLYKDGYRGPIYSTAPTRDVARELLLDAQHLMEREGSSEPIYGIEDIDGALSLWRAIPYHQPMNVGGMTIELYDAGHILGSASIKVTQGEVSVVFSGDLGNVPAPLVRDTEYIQNAQYALVESAYGNRVHESVAERKMILEDLIEDTVAKKGTLLIPAFAMERTQELLYELSDLVDHGRIPKVPIFIDSPLAIKLTTVYEKYMRDPHFFDAEALERLRHGEDIFDFKGLRFTLTKEESKEINDIPPPKVIIAGSGMSNGGRILHHEIRYLPDPKSTILIVGYQTEGTLGRAILDGVSEVTIMGERVPVRCTVKAIGAYSAHADQPLLLKWVGSMRSSLKKVFVVQGELDQSEPLAQKIRDDFAIDATVPRPGTTYELL